jgi:hypothetical protein
VLAELSYFFCQLYAKELSWTVIDDFEKVAPMLLYKLEKIFPPSFINLLQHLICTSCMRHEWGAHAGPLVLSNGEMSKDSS